MCYLPVSLHVLTHPMLREFQPPAFAEVKKLSHKPSHRHTSIPITLTLLQTAKAK